MTSTYRVKISRWWLLALALLAVVALPGVGRGEILKVGMPNQVLYPDPDFASPPVCPVPLGSEVNKFLTLGDWFKVGYGDKKGWLNRLAFPQLKPPPGQMPGLLSGGAVRPGAGDEVALGGKAERMPPKDPLSLEDLDRRTLKKDQPLYRDPDPSGTPLVTAPAGARVQTLAAAGDWRKVKYGNQMGWLPQEALAF